MPNALRALRFISLAWFGTAAWGAAPQGPTAEWRLDEGAGQATADAAGSNDGILGSSGGTDGNDPTWVTGISEDALHFDTGGGFTTMGNDFVEIANDALLEPASVTVEAWVRGTFGAFATPVSLYIVSKGQSACGFASYALHATRSGGGDGLLFYVHPAAHAGIVESPNAGSAVWDGNWHRVTGTYDGTTVRLYVDGSEVGSGTAASPGGPLGYGLPDNDSLLIGAYAVAPPCDPGGFIGDIDEVKLWSRALPPEEVNPVPVLYQQKISSLEGGLSEALDSGDSLGVALTPLGDLNGGGVRDLAVGSQQDDDGGTNRGAVRILFLDQDGSVASKQKISDTDGGFTGTLDDDDNFGVALADLGDLDSGGPSVKALAVGAYLDDDGGTDRGAVWILFLNADGTVDGHQKISATEGGFAGTLDDLDQFGSSLEALGDLDGDGVTDLAVGAWADDDGGTDRGAVWILFLDADGTVDGHQKISSTEGGFTTLDDFDRFGVSLASLGDLDGAGTSVRALAVGELDDLAGADAGAFWVLSLSSAGVVLSESKITESLAGFTGGIGAGDLFGTSLESLGVVGSPGASNLAVGARNSDSGAGSMWMVTLDQEGRVVSQARVSEGEGGFTGALDPGDAFGFSMASLGDLDGDGRVDLAAGAFGDDDGATDAGAVWICFLNDGTLALGASATTWDGSTDTDWTDATNWSNGVPDATKTAIIPDASTTPNDPAITVGGQECNTLWIQAGGTLDVSAGASSLGVHGGATVMGPITGTGQLVFETASVLAGNSTIGLTFSPAVKAVDDLVVQGGPLEITGALEVGTVTFFLTPSGSLASARGDLDLQGLLKVGESVVVRGTLSSSSSSQLTVEGSGACVVAGQIDIRGDVTTSCLLSVENATVDTTIFNVVSGWPGGVSIDVNGTSTLLTPDLVINGDLVLAQGQFAVGVDGSIEVQSITIEDGAIFDITGFQTLLKAPATITVEAGGQLLIGPGGELLLETGTGTITIGSGGTLRLDGIPSSRAALSGFDTHRFHLVLDSGSILQAKGFAFRLMDANGIVVGPEVALAAAPYDLRGGLFDFPAPGGVLLDIQRAQPTELRYLRFDNSLAAAGVKNVRTSLASAPITLVNWSGSLAPDAVTAETLDDDPGETTPPERIIWAPPQASVAQNFTASWGPGHVALAWNTLAEVDSAAFLVQRSPEPPGSFATVVTAPSVGPSPYAVQDQGAYSFAAHRYRLLELLTHGEVRFLFEAMLPASGIVLRPVGPTPTPTPPTLFPQPLVVGPCGTYPDVHAALRALEGKPLRGPVTLTLASGRHESFELGRELALDLRLEAEPGAVVDAARAPMRITDLGASRTLELVGLVVDARASFAPALVIEDASGVVLLQHVELRGGNEGPALRLTQAIAVALQGGAIEGGLLLEGGSRATASGVELSTFELTGGSVLETRGGRGPWTEGEGRGWSPPDPGPRGSAAVPGPGWSPALRGSPAVRGSPMLHGGIEAGSRWLERAPAPRLTVEGSEATLAADGGGLAWLGQAPRLGFGGRARPWVEGVLLLDPQGLGGVGPVRILKDGRARWSLGGLPHGELGYLQGLVLDRESGRVRLSDVVRCAPGR